jgi:spore photoproduct lyase
MYPLTPSKVYAHEALRDNPDAMTRMRRFLATMKYAEDAVDWYTHEDSIRVSREVAQWNPDRGVANWKYCQPVVFTNFAVTGTLEEDAVYKSRPTDVPLFNLPHILGYLPHFRLHHGKKEDAEGNMVCWPSNFLSVSDGCSHGCVYCGTGRGGKALVIALNVHEYLQKVIRKVVEDNPWQKCFLMMGSADLATLEPEYGLYEDFLNLLGEYEDRYGYFHTNGDCVDWVKDLTRRDRVMAVWSLASNEAGAVLEPCAPSASSRIAAMARLNELGVPVRVKLKPVLPIRGWRESYAGTIKELLTKARPETLGFTSLIWMDYERLTKTFDLDQLDPTFVEAAREAQEEMKATRHGPFPHAKRAELYRFLIQEARKHDPKIPLFVSTETTEMWDELAEELGQDPNHFFCGCNPILAPGPRFVPSELDRSNYANNKETRKAPVA